MGYGGTYHVERDTTHAPWCGIATGWREWMVDPGRRWTMTVFRATGYKQETRQWTRTKSRQVGRNEDGCNEVNPDNVTDGG